MNVKVLRQFCQRLVAFEGSDRYLGFKCWRVIPPGSFGHALAPLQGRYAAIGRARLSLIDLSEFPGPALFAVSSLTGSLLSSGALGSLSSIQSKLANYTAFDGYARNFSVNLSGLIKAPISKARTNPLPTNTYSGPRVMKFAGGEMAFALEADGGAFQHLGEFGYNADQAQALTTGYTLFTSKSGSVSGLGYGATSSYPFAKALYNDDMIARQMSDFDASNVGSLTQGGYQFSYGTSLSPDLRVAATYSATPESSVLSPNAAQNNQIKFGLSYRVNNHLTAGMTYSNVAERSSLLGAAYNSGSILALGQNATDVIGFSLGYRVDRNSSVLLNAEFGTTKAGSGDAGSLFSATSTIQSQAWSATYLQQNIWKANDQLAASIKQPLRLSSGSAAITTASVDAQGFAVYENSWASLVPDGREIDLTVNYRMPTNKTDTLTLQAAYQKDALNIAGSNNAQLGLIWNKRF